MKTINLTIVLTLISLMGFGQFENLSKDYSSTPKLKTPFKLYGVEFNEVEYISSSFGTIREIHFIKTTTVNKKEKHDICVQIVKGSGSIFFETQVEQQLRKGFYCKYFNINSPYLMTIGVKKIKYSDPAEYQIVLVVTKR